MALIVQKYGGTSVADIERIENVARRMLDCQHKGNDLVGVVSAMAGVTNNLLEMTERLYAKSSFEPSEREMDVLLSTGEQTTIALLALAIRALGGKAISLTGAQAGIVTEGSHTRARIRSIGGQSVRKYLKRGNIVIIAGFQGMNRLGDITTLGRGGSDLTAIAVAAALEAELCQIFTDVDGVFTCDPRVVKSARKLQEICYDELMEMAGSGSKVMQLRSVEFAKKFDVVFEVRSSLNNKSGTIVKSEKDMMEKPVVRAVSIEKDQAKVMIRDVPDKPGVAAKIFSALAKAEIVIDVIIQNVSKTGVTDISFTVHENESERAQEVTREILKAFGGESSVEALAGIAKLSIVGIGMRSHSGVAAKAFEALADADINIDMISTSEIKISIILQSNKSERAAKLIHDAFELGEKVLADV